MGQGFRGAPVEMTDVNISVGGRFDFLLPIPYRKDEASTGKSSGGTQCPRFTIHPMLRVGTGLLCLLISFASFVVVWGQSRKTHVRQTSVQSKSTATVSNPVFTPVPIFEDIAASAGLTTRHISSKDKRYVIESMSGGIGLVVCDKHGQLGGLVVNGYTLERYPQSGGPTGPLAPTDAGPTLTTTTGKAGRTPPSAAMGRLRTYRRSQE